MYWIDQKYLGMLSAQLPLYSVKSSNPFKASCRCPICGDSQKNQYKKRGHFYQHKDIIIFKCFNCGATRSVKSLLKEFNPELRREYDLEVFSENRPTAVEQKPIVHEYLTSDEYNAPLKKLKKISQLPVGHPAKLYVEKRGIPSSQHFRLYYAPKFFTWSNSIVPDKFKLDRGDEPRLVIPFFDKKGNMFGFQGRSFDPKAEVKYMTVMTRGDHVKVFGLDQVDLLKRVYVVEGPIDSMFVPNSLAMAGADVNMDFLDRKNTVMIFDNEPRNKEIVRRMNKVIENGWSICIWPEYINQKDINDMVLSGLSTQKVVDIIDNNTYSNLEAKLKMATWSKI